jgi:hypothetical protein
MNWLNNQGGGPSLSGPDNTPEVEIITQNGVAIVTQQGQYLVTT